MARQDPLVKYRGYLEGLPPERRPDLVVITGDLTATGDKHDLTTIATILRNDFPKWDAHLADHIFVVPGPRDVTWERSGRPGLTAFYEAFHDFALPSGAHALPTHGAMATAGLNCIAYPLDTCYTLDEFRTDLKDEFHQHADAYHGFVRRYRRVTRSVGGLFGIGRGTRRAALEELRGRYLRLTEDNQLTLLDAGRINPDDLRTFTGWILSLRDAPDTPDAPLEPLKILITHHPLATQPDSDGIEGSRPQVQQHFRTVMRQARDAGFHLALHGHIHKPQVLSDLSILEGTDIQHPLRQIGAGSLGDDGMFNEITAEFSAEDGQSQWRLEIRTVNVLAARPDDASSLVLLNPTEAAAEQTERLKREAHIRDDFDARIRLVMRQFSETVYRTQPEEKSDKSKEHTLPQSAMQTVESIIRDVVFKDFYVRVRLLLKDKETSRRIPTLRAAYLAPPPSDGPGTLTYPASIAALSLVLGRTLTFPHVTQEELRSDDHEWLKRSDKVPGLLRILEALQEEAGGRSYPGLDVARRYAALHDKLSALKDSEGPVLHGSDFYQQPPVGSAPPSYPHFVCVPFPLRPPLGGFLPEVPEIAVLDVGVRSPERSGEKRETVAEAPVEVFTAERLRMLEALAELIGMILTTSSALGKPRGVWDDRFRV